MKPKFHFVTRKIYDFSFSCDVIATTRGSSRFARGLRNDETIISSISVTDIFFDVYLGKWNYRAIPKVKTWSYFSTIPKVNYLSSYTKSVS